MVTYSALRTVDAKSWNLAAEAMRRFAEALAVKADELGDVIDWLSGHWAGTAATVALDRLSTIRAELYAAFPGIVSVDQAATELGAAVTLARDRLAYASEPRPGSIVEVTPEGVVTFIPTSDRPDQADLAERYSVEQTLRRAIEAAAHADHDADERLRGLSFDLDRPVAVPAAPAGSGPVAVAAWWRGLPPDQQKYVIAMEPAMIAGLDGVPADDRDQASRLLLHRETATLRAQDALLRENPLAAGNAKMITTVDGKINGLELLEDRLDGTGEVRAYLLGLDASAGRAIVSIANPDDAANTLTFVPGVTSSLTNVGVTLGSIDNIERASAQLPPTEAWIPTESGGVATIGWVNYDAPSSIRTATSAAPAQTAADPLSTFENGLRTTSTLPVDHESVLGYSYGSVVVGAASQRGGLHADDIILVGSPGTGVRQASDLGVPPDHVWATAANHDLIPRLSTPSALVGDLLGRPSDQSWFGTDPTAPSFGAQVFASNPGQLTKPLEAHTSYFDIGTPSLTSIARIAVGDTPDLPH